MHERSVCLFPFIKLAREIIRTLIIAEEKGAGETKPDSKNVDNDRRNSEVRGFDVHRRMIVHHALAACTARVHLHVGLRRLNVDVHSQRLSGVRRADATF